MDDRSTGELRAVARARAGGAARLLRRAPVAHAVRRRRPPASPGRPRAACCTRCVTLGYIAHRRPAVRAHAEGARPRLRVPVVAAAQRHRPAVHGGALRAGARERRRGRARRRRDRLRGAGAHEADHDHLAVDRARACRPLCTSMGRVLLAGLADDELDAFLAKATMQPPTDTAVAHRRRSCAPRSSTGAPAGLRARRPGARGRACARSPLPLRDRSGRVLAAINVSTHAGRVTLRELRAEILPVLLSTARRDQRPAGEALIGEG